MDKVSYLLLLLASVCAQPLPTAPYGPQNFNLYCTMPQCLILTNDGYIVNHGYGSSVPPPFYSATTVQKVRTISFYGESNRIRSFQADNLSMMPAAGSDICSQQLIKTITLTSGLRKITVSYISYTSVAVNYHPTVLIQMVVLTFDDGTTQTVTPITYDLSNNFQSEFSIPQYHELSGFRGVGNA